MTPQCPHPDLHMAVLDEARGHETRDPELAEHLASCPSCSGAAERLRRMVPVWEADQPNEETIASAATRFEANRATRRAELNFVGSLPFALTGAAAAYLLLLATRTVTLPFVSATRPAHAHPVTAAVDPARAQLLAAPHIETVNGIVPLADGVRLELKQGESAHVALTNGHFSDLRGPCVVEFWSSPTEVGGYRLSRPDLEPPRASSAGAVQVRESPAPPTRDTDTPRNVPPSTAAPIDATGARPKSGALGTTPAPASGAIEGADLPGPNANPAFQRAWARAAAALRRDDFNAADAAFDELGRAPDPATRDAARLERAQLWIAHGRAVAVRPVLVDLAKTGTTPLVRQRAAEFLSRDNH